jgi:outer membrane receptor protein involved in Fe transport
VVSSNTIIASGTVDSSHSYVYDKNWDRTDKFLSIGWRNELDFGNEWKGAFDLGYSRAAREEVYIQSVARANAFSSFEFSNPGTSGASSTSWSTPQDLTDPTVVQLTNDPNWAELRNPNIDDKIQSAQLRQSQPELGRFKRSRCGLAYNQRSQDVLSNAYLLTLTGASDPALGSPSAAIPERVAGARDDRRRRHPPARAELEVPGVMDLYDRSLKDPWSAQTSKFAVHEKVGTGFLKLDIGTTWGSVPVRGNLGVQFVYTDQGSEGFAWNDDGSGTCCVTPVHGGANYTDVLPSLNLVFDLKEDLILRFGLGKTMARPRMDDMRAGADQPILTPWLPSPSETHRTPANGRRTAAASPSSSPGAQTRSTFRWRSTSRNAATSPSLDSSRT